MDLPTTGHMLNFISTLEHHPMVGVRDDPIDASAVARRGVGCGRLDPLKVEHLRGVRG